MNPTSAPERLDYLDSARGIAALMVMFGHYINWKYEHTLVCKIASIPFNAHDAVSFFFILSGLVLSYPYLQYNKSMDVGKFYVSRLFRLYPAFWIAVLLNLIYANRSQLNFGTLFDSFVLNKYQFWEEVILVRGFNNLYLPGWTLTIEMIYSFFMPILIFVGRHNKRLLLWMLPISFLMAQIAGPFMFHFTLGSILGCYLNEFKGLNFKQTILYRYRVVVLLVAAVLFSIRPLTRISPLGSSLIYFLDVMKLDFFIFTGIASAIFIIYLIHFKGMQNIFRNPILIFFGKISYGIYLMHWVFVSAIGDYWESQILPLFSSAKMAFVIVLILYFVTSVIAATLLHYLIEIPFMRMGKRFVGKIKPTLTI